MFLSIKSKLYVYLHTVYYGSLYTMIIGYHFSYH